MKELKNFDIILASQSPRRQDLLKGLDLNFRIIPAKADESYPPELKREQIALYLAEKKARALKSLLAGPETILISADTIVWLDGQDLGKPVDRADAIQMLQKLSGRRHEVITAVGIFSIQKSRLFHAVTEVYFKELSQEEIEYYVDNFQPYDKAGAYGIQEWIGYTGISRIEGSYFNVVGLPVHELYEELIKF
jgi:septum formation protein